MILYPVHKIILTYCLHSIFWKEKCQLGRPISRTTLESKNYIFGILLNWTLCEKRVLSYSNRIQSRFSSTFEFSKSHYIWNWMIQQLRKKDVKNVWKIESITKRWVQLPQNGILIKDTKMGNCLNFLSFWRNWRPWNL